MSIVFRVDANARIGSGHLMRCLALAEALQERGESVFFLLRDPAHGTRTLLNHRKVSLIELPRADAVLSETENTYADWLGVTQTIDAQQTLAELASLSTVDYVIVDHYGIDHVWEHMVRAVGYRVVAIDDLCRRHEADFVIDQTLERAPAAYLPLTFPHALLGSDYALLRTRFNVLREQGRSAGQGILLLTMGGVDQPNVTLRVMQTLINRWPDFIHRVVVVLPSTAPHFATVSDFVSRHGERFELHSFVDDMAMLMQNAQFAIGAPGVTTWERACLGLPAVLIPIADNQKDVAAAMSRVKAVNLVDMDAIESGLSAAISHLSDHYPEFVKRNKCVADGLGARRVVQMLFPQQTKSGAAVSLKKADAAHIALVFEWQQHPHTRRYARNPQPPVWEEHLAWMTAQLQSADVYFYMIYLGDKPVGVVRLNRRALREQNNRFEISIFLDPDNTSGGIGRIALQRLMELHREAILLATVLPENAVSHRLFQRAGFAPVSETEYCRIGVPA